jgi:hypothetical protein
LGKRVSRRMGCMQQQALYSWYPGYSGAQPAPIHAQRVPAKSTGIPKKALWLDYSINDPS